MPNLLERHRLIPDVPWPDFATWRASGEQDAVEKARSLSAAALVQKVKQSGLRGRGGAGFPAGRKWEALSRNACRRRFVVCNAAEGEPGTFKDRWLIRNNPYAILEGMIIAARAIGARELIFATKASYRVETRRIREASEEMRAAGLLDGLEFELFAGPDEYLFGEEKALLNAIETGLPLPREAFRPPYEVGLYATPRSSNPALVNNVETFAHIPFIVLHGAQGFRELGSRDTPGTLLSTLCGDVQRAGVYEVPAGIPLAELFARAEALPGRRWKAALCGVSAPVIPASQFELTAEFHSMRKAGYGLGAAGFILIDDSVSMPRVAQAVARYLYVESCDQCAPCKHGLGRASRLLDAFMLRPSRETLEEAIAAARSAPQGNRCFLPSQGAGLIPSLVETFRGEFEGMIVDGRPAGPAWTLPRIADYDEKARRFVLADSSKERTPNW